MARVDPQNYAFVFAQRDEVIDSDHPDFEFWSEELHLAEVMASGEALPATDAANPAPEKSQDPPPPVLAVDLGGAAESLGVGNDFFREHVKPELLIVRRGRRQFIAVAELQRWLDESGEQT